MRRDSLHEIFEIGQFENDTFGKKCASPTKIMLLLEEAFRMIE